MLSTPPVYSSVGPLFTNLPVLETERLTVRPMRLEDAPAMFTYASDPAVSRFTVWDHHRSIEDTLRYLDCVIRNYARGVVEDWGLVVKDGAVFAGTCGFFTWDPEHHRAEIHYAIGRPYWGKGLMTEAVRALLQFGFEHMDLHRIEAKCMRDNTGSERVMQKAGMSFEGIQREILFAKGRYHDLKSYAILAEEWQRLPDRYVLR